MEKLTAEMGYSSSALTSDIDRTGLVIGEVIARSPLNQIVKYKPLECGI
jgi:hypothetical protein